MVKIVVETPPEVSVAGCHLFKATDASKDEFYTSIKGCMSNCGLCTYWNSTLGFCLIEGIMLEQNYKSA